MRLMGEGTCGEKSGHAILVIDLFIDDYVVAIMP